MLRHTIFLAALLSSLWVSAQPATPVALDGKRVALASIHIGAKQRAVSRAFGQPIRSVPELAVFCGSEIEVIYPGVHAYFCDGSLVNLVCTTRQYRTPDGVRVGMHADDAVARLGASGRRTDEQGIRLIYPTADGDLALILHVENDRVSRIELWCDFT